MGRDFIVGILFLLALSLMILAAFLIRGLPSGAENYEMVAFFDDVGGLDNGDAVRIHGLRIGEVTSVEYQDGQDRIEVHLRLFRKLPPHEDYEILIVPSSALGGTVVEYSPGSSQRPVVDARKLSGQAFGDLFTRGGRLLEENADTLTAIIDDVKDVTAALKEGKGILGKIMVDEELSEKILGIVDDIGQFAEKANGDENLVSLLVSNKEIHDQVSEIVGALHQIAQEATAEDTTLNVLLGPDFGKQISRISDDLEIIVEDIRQQKGLLGRVISDTEMADDIRRVVTGIADGPGIVHALIFEEEMRADFAAVVSNLRTTTEALSGPRGTLGKLIHSDDIYRRLEQVLKTVRDGAEDLREQAPINTFFNAIFAAF